MTVYLPYIYIYLYLKGSLEDLYLAPTPDYEHIGYNIPPLQGAMLLRLKGSCQVQMNV